MDALGTPRPLPEPEDPNWSHQPLVTLYIADGCSQ